MAGTTDLRMQELRELLEEKWRQYERPEFIADDPVQIPHLFDRKEDIEISAFLTATIAWGNRTSILVSARRMMEIMDYSPYAFIMNTDPDDKAPVAGFVHRTFQAEDLACFIRCLSRLYRYHGGLEGAFTKGYRVHGHIMDAITSVRALFFDPGCPGRSGKHFSDPSRGSAAKRINLFLRWMIRSSEKGVDFSLWKSIPVSALHCPLDVHTADSARKLGLLTRRQNDRKAVEELTQNLRTFDQDDPIKYDFALFGLGRYELLGQ